MNKEIISSKYTAIKRNKLSSPAKYLLDNGFLNKNKSILDLGCGRGEDVNILKKNGFKIYGHDPNWYSNLAALSLKYDVVLSTYVFCVISEEIRLSLVKDIKGMLKDGGKAYISVRRDIASTKTTKKGTTQYPVYLDYKVIYDSSNFCIYELN